MIKSFVWTLIFWSLFIVTNTIGDAVRFYDVFHWYGDLRLWHFLKIWWMLWLFLTGWSARNLVDEIFPIRGVTKKAPGLKVLGVLGFFLLWFFLFRLIVHESFMAMWRS